jgi:hypothetical protein
MEIKVTEVTCFDSKIDEQYFIDKIQILIDSGFHLQKGDIFDVKNLLKEDVDYINYKVGDRQIFVSSENIEIIYYIDLFE